VSHAECAPRVLLRLEKTDRQTEDARPLHYAYCQTRPALQYAHVTNSNSTSVTVQISTIQRSMVNSFFWYVTDVT